MHDERIAEGSMDSIYTDLDTTELPAATPPQGTWPRATTLLCGT
ncbi:hypothetical protein AB0M68_36210 [Streptomyces sp. NPDC051453]